MFLAKIHYGDGWITLNLNGTWTPSSDDSYLKTVAQLATILSQTPFYEYSPSHGGYGTLLAHKIVERIGGRIELPKVDPRSVAPHGIVF